MRKLLAILLLIAAPAFAQTTVKQSGNVTPGHVPYWVTTGVIGDGGTAANGKLTSLGITASGPSFCINSAAITSAGWQQMCFGVTTAGGGTISLQNFGTASPQNFTVTINGTAYPFPFSIAGILGPNPSVANNFACWNNTVGTLLKDCGLSSTGTNNWTGLQNLNGGATAPTQAAGDSSTNVATDAFVSASQRSKLTATTTFFVNASGSLSEPCGAFTCSPGNDANNCASITTPCQTIQRSLTTMTENYDFAAQTVNLQAADGAYNECILLPSYIAVGTTDKNVFILGNAGDVTKVVVNCVSGSAFTSVNSPQGWVLKNLTVKASNICVDADYHSTIFWDGGDLNDCPNADVQAVNAGAFIEFINHNYTTTGSKQIHAATKDGGQVSWNAVTATVVGSPTYSFAFLSSENGGIFEDTGLTVSGAFTGPKYSLYGRPVNFTTGATQTTSNSTQYIGQGSIANSEINYFTLAVTTRKIVDFFVNVTTAPGVGQSFVFTLRVGGSPSALTCTIANTATSCSDTVHATNSIAGNTVADVQVISSAGAATAVMSASAVMQ